MTTVRFFDPEDDLLITQRRLPHWAQDGAVVTVTLNRPELRNPISDADMVDALVAALETLNADMTVRVAVLTGAGSAFSSGGNLRQMGAAAADRSPVDTRRYYETGIQRIPRAFETLEVPIIAAVNGPAIGAGCDLACMCDMRIAGESARFAESFVKVGIVPGDGGAWLLQRVVGYSKACEMTFTGDPLDQKGDPICLTVHRERKVSLNSSMPCRYRACVPRDWC